MTRKNHSAGLSRSKHISNVLLSGIEKRYTPTKHYVFILDVMWSTGRMERIFRKYSDFYEFHMNLLDSFPEEGGQGSKRTIPFLPGRKLFQRSEVHTVAAKRQTSLADYCQDLIALPPHISHSKLVNKFFEPRDSDKNPPDNPQKTEKSSLLQAVLPFLSKKLDSGSGMKKSASFNGTPAELAPIKDEEELYVSGPITFPHFVAIADYAASEKREVSLQGGQMVAVVEKHDNGWWFVQVDDKQGWAPASYLEPQTEADKDNDDPEALSQYEQFQAICAYEKELNDEVGFPKGAVINVMHKMMDGWWIVSYEGSVGYAPATYLQPYKKSSFLKKGSSSTSRCVAKKPTQRRCTIKVAKTPKVTGKKPDDLEVYRRKSVQMDHHLRLIPADPDEDDANIIYMNDAVNIESDDENYENEEVIQMIAAQKQESITQGGRTTKGHQRIPSITLNNKDLDKSSPGSLPRNPPQPSSSLPGASPLSISPGDKASKSPKSEKASKLSLSPVGKSPSPKSSPLSSPGRLSFRKPQLSPRLLKLGKKKWQVLDDDTDEDEDDEYTAINEDEMQEFEARGPATFAAHGGIVNPALSDSGSDYDDVADDLYINVNNDNSLKEYLQPKDPNSPLQASSSSSKPTQTPHTTQQGSSKKGKKPARPPTGPNVATKSSPLNKSSPGSPNGKNPPRGLHAQGKPVPTPKPTLAARIAMFEQT